MDRLLIYTVDTNSIPDFDGEDAVGYYVEVY